MDVYKLIACALALLPVVATAQVTAGPRRVIRAVGSGEVSIQPDQARIQISITTRANTAAEASQQNATRSAAVFDAIRALIGNAGEIRTSGYNVSPYSEGNPPRQAGFQVTNSVLVTVNNLNITGRVIDTAIGAGATRVDYLVLGLRDDSQPRLQALRAAGTEARQRAEAIATGLGVRIGQVLAADESGFRTPIISNRIDAGAATLTPTPIVPGTLTVTATVSVEYEIIP